MMNLCKNTEACIILHLAQIIDNHKGLFNIYDHESKVYGWIMNESKISRETRRLLY